MQSPGITLGTGRAASQACRAPTAAGDCTCREALTIYGTVTETLRFSRVALPERDARHVQRRADRLRRPAEPRALRHAQRPAALELPQLLENNAMRRWPVTPHQKDVTGTVTSKKKLY